MNIKKRNKILLITGTYFPEISGGNLQCKKLYDSLNNLFNFKILTFTKKKKLKTHKRNVLISTIYRIYIDNKFFTKLLCVLNNCFYLLKNRKNYDIVHIFGLSNIYLPSILISKLLKKKIIVKFSSYKEDNFLAIFNKSKIIYYFYKLLCDYFICISPAFIKDCRTLKIDPKKYKLIQNFLITKENRTNLIKESSILKKFKTNYLNVIFVGHFSKDKRPYFAYEVWKKSFLKNYKTNLIFIGNSTSSNFETDINLKKKIVVDAKKNKLLNNILFVNYTSNIEIFYKYSNILLFPSIREGMPNTLIESLYYGLKCLSNKLPGVTDWLKFENLTIVKDSEDLNLWSNKLNQLIVKKGKRNFNKKVLKTFDNKKTLKKYVNIYKKLLKSYE
jgi:hypothetical protein